jgi:hypothetical protein
MSITRPLSEQFRITAKAWVEADKAASLMEECKSVVFSEMMSKLTGEDLSLPVNRAEILVKGSQDYKDFVTTMVELRSKANLLKAQLEFIRMQHSEQQSSEATARSERRL